jgi:hypothetical protein
VGALALPWVLPVTRRRIALWILLVVAIIAPGTQASAQTAKTPAERFVLEHLKINGVADLSQSGLKDKTISHEFLEALITNANPGPVVAIYGIAIRHATINGQLSVTNVTIPFPLSFDTCTFEEGFDFTSDIFARDFRLNGALVGSTSDDFPALFEGARFSGSVSVDESFFNNGVDFTDAAIGGELSSEDVHYGDEADFDGITIKGDATFKGSRFNDELNLTDAQLFDLEIDNTPPKTPKDLPGPITLYLEQAHIGHSLDITNAPMSAFYASFLNVDGPTNIKNSPPLGLVDLRHSHFQSLTITGIDQWLKNQNPVNFDLEGLSFGWVEVPEAKVQPTAVRLRNLIDQSTFTPQPYLELEAFLHSVGSYTEADNTYFDMRRRERNQLDWWKKPFDLMLDVSIRYGRQPWRAAIFALVLVCVGAIVFFRKIDMEHEEKACTDEWYRSFWFSLDLLSPVDLGVAKKWRPKAPWRRLYAQTQRVAGWILIPLIAAAITGIIK